MVLSPRERSQQIRPGSPPSRAQNRDTGGRSDTNIKKTSLRYPYEMLTDNTDYLKIEIAEYVAPGLNLSDKTTGILGEQKEIIDSSDSKVDTINQNFSLETGSRKNRQQKKIENTIYLPIPQQLSDTTSLSWGDAGLSPIEAFGVAATQATIDKGLKGAIESFLTLSNSGVGALQDPQVQKAITAALSGTAVGALGGNVSGTQLVSRATGQVFNPNLELLFEGVNIRSFPFSFELFPRDRKEAEEVKKIIRTLKIAASARKSGGSGEIFISAPRVFHLTYMKGRNKHPFLNTFLPMALTSVNLTYTGSNTYSTFYDGTPTHMRMDLTFKELNPVYAEDYTEYEDAKIGVGF
jgi:hypothetical protein